MLLVVLATASICTAEASERRALETTALEALQAAHERRTGVLSAELRVAIGEDREPEFDLCNARWDDVDEARRQACFAAAELQLWSERASIFTRYLGRGWDVVPDEGTRSEWASKGMSGLIERRAEMARQMLPELKRLSALYGEEKACIQEAMKAKR